MKEHLTPILAAVFKELSLVFESYVLFEIKVKVVLKVVNHLQKYRWKTLYSRHLVQTLAEHIETEQLNFSKLNLILKLLDERLTFILEEVVDEQLNQITAGSLAFKSQWLALDLVWNHILD
jgi:hypothetical protein